MAISPQEFVEKWGDDEFTQCAVADAELLQPQAALFLVEAGLPRQCAPNLQFKLEEGLPAFEADGRTFVRLGAEEEFAAIGLDRAGAVWSIDTDGDFPPRFMNSSVAALAECLLLYRDSIGRTALGPSPEQKTVRFLGVTYDVTPPAPQDADAIREELSRLRREIGQADPPALATAESWWSILLEDEESQYT